MATTTAPGILLYPWPSTIFTSVKWGQEHDPREICGGLRGRRCSRGVSSPCRWDGVVSELLSRAHREPEGDADGCSPLCPSLRWTSLSHRRLSASQCSAQFPPSQFPSEPISQSWRLTLKKERGHNSHPRQGVPGLGWAERTDKAWAYPE